MEERDSLISEICKPLDPLVIERLRSRIFKVNKVESLMDEPLVDKPLLKELIKINRQIQEKCKIDKLKQRKDSLISEIYKKLDPLLLKKSPRLRLSKGDESLMDEPSVDKPKFQELIETIRQIQELDGATGQFKRWGSQVEEIRSGIWVGMADEGCGRIAEAYVQLFFSGLTGRERDEKVEEIRKIIANESNEQADTRKLRLVGYGDEVFFDRTAAPIRQLIAAALENPDLSGDENLFENIVKFCSMARAVIADVTGSEHCEHFGQPSTVEDNHGIPEAFERQFTPAQNALCLELSGGQFNGDSECISVLNASLCKSGEIIHSAGNMLFMGGGLFKELHETAKYLRDNPNNPKALEDFTKAAKNFIYAWAQSSTCNRGQAAMLMMIIDGMAKYAGCKFVRPEVPEMAKTRLAELSEQIPTENRNAEHKTSEIFLQDFYRNPDVPALYAQSFGRFDETYQCTFVPI
jgi:hypothetical protein